jgi:tetratricopeptide (TPR) repeat protein
MNTTYRLAALLMGTTVLVAQPFYSEKATAQVSIGKLAQDVTVFIQGVNNADNFGSGVIIGHSGKSYTVLTAAHVVAPKDQFTIQTGDGVQYTLKTIQKLPNIDMAVVQFDSSSSYQTARLGNSDQMSLTDPISVAGFPKPGLIVKVPVLSVISGQIAQVFPANAAQDGYGFGYNNLTRAGMSGGPVFNASGEVIAIHGRKEKEADDTSTTATWLNLGIPINRYKAGSSQIAKDTGVDSQKEAQRQAALEAKRKAEKQAQLDAQQRDQERSRQAALDAQKKAQTQAQIQAKRQAELDAKRQAQVPSTQQLPPQRSSVRAILGATTPFSAPFVQSRPAATTSTKQVCENIRINTIIVPRCRTETVNQRSESTSDTAPSDPSGTYVNSGNDRVANGNFQAALQEYNNAIQGNPSLAIAFFNRGLAFYNLDQKDRAISDFSKAADLFKSQGDSEKLQKTQNILQALTQANS